VTAAPRVLVAAGLDPTGGAGLVADVEALVAVGARAMAVATALTIQGPRGAAGWEAVSPRFIARQVEELLRGRGERPRALKTGMLGGDSTAAHLARLFSRRGLAGLPLVVDPVLAASSGLSLFGHGHRRSPAAGLGPLLARATVVTPNLPELALLTGAEIRDDDDAVDAARRLACEAVLVKGGHRGGDPVDLLVRGRAVKRFTGRRRPGTARGTGCRLASAMAGLLAQGASLEDAVRGAKRFVERYLDALG
jgi:hydroxymethylpyrimidine/phosphomethylpyrimidine kinase